MDDISKDERFAHISKDPRFRSMSRKQKKVKIDKRFQSMFHDKSFKLKYSVDKRGKPMNFSTNENLKKYYELSEDSDDSDASDDDDMDEEDELIAKLKKKVKAKKDIKIKSNDNGNASSDVKNDELVKPGCSGFKPDKNKYKQLKEKSGSSDEDDDSSDEDDASSDEDKDSSKEDSDDDDESSESGDSSDAEDSSGAEAGDNAPDYARGEGLIESSSDDNDDDDDDDDEEVDDEFDHQWGELDKNVPEADELSSRLAVCNMDWDRIKSEDLFVLFNSFKSSKDVIKSVRIYPSEFGLQRMREEQIHGPTELKELAKTVEVEAEVESEEDEEDSEGNRYHREKLRQYQLNRLKYYYAVVECDSIETASKIYDECDGREYESSSARLDLRFIPDGMTFDETPKSECHSLPDTSTYKSSMFFTSALCQSKVDLTWDETDQDRIKTTMKKYDKKGEVNEDDFKAYLASDSEDEGQNYEDLVDKSESDDPSDEDQQIEKYKSLLKDIDETSTRKGDMEMEIEWEPGLKETTEDILKTKAKTKDQTPWESYLEQKKEKKKQKKEEQKMKKLAKKEGKMEKTFSDDEIPGGIDLNDNFFTDLKQSEPKKSKKKKKKVKLTEEEEMKKEKEEAELALLMMDEEEEGKQHFSLKNLVEKKKRKKSKKDVAKEDDDFEVDVSDNRFDAVFKSHLFNIDPSAPEFKKTKGMERMIEEKLKRRKGENVQGEKIKKIKTDEEDELLTRKEESLSSLVKSVKSKTQQFQTKKKKK